MDQNVQRIEFAGFRLDPARRHLTRSDGTPVILNSRAFDTLLALVARRGETLSKKSLMDAVWPQVVVADNNLNQAISAIRKALGDTQHRHRIILTIPGRGYCFIADIEAVDESPRQKPDEPGRPRTVVSVSDYFLSG